MQVRFKETEIREVSRDVDIFRGQLGPLYVAGYSSSNGEYDAPTEGYYYFTEEAEAMEYFGRLIEENTPCEPVPNLGDLLREELQRSNNGF